METTVIKVPAGCVVQIVDQPGADGNRTIMVVVGEPHEVMAQPVGVPEDVDALGKLLQPVTDLPIAKTRRGIRKRILGVLEKLGINWVWELVQFTEKELREQPNFGRGALDALKTALQLLKLHLGMEFCKSEEMLAAYGFKSVPYQHNERYKELTAQASNQTSEHLHGLMQKRLEHLKKFTQGKRFLQRA